VGSEMCIRDSATPDREVLDQVFHLEEHVRVGSSFDLLHLKRDLRLFFSELPASGPATKAFSTALGSSLLARIRRETGKRN